MSNEHHVVIEVNNIECKITTPLTMDQQALLCDLCSFPVGGKEFARNSFNKKHNSEWDGMRRLFHARQQTFPIGLLSIVRGFFEANCWQVVTIDKMRHSQVIGQFSCTPKEERQYQDNALVQAMLNGFGIIKAATGSGKTTIAAKVATTLARRSVFLVHTKDLLYQAIDAFKAMTDMKVGQIGDGEVKFGDITVATVQTLCLVLGMENESYSYDEDIGDAEFIDSDLLKIKRQDILQWVSSIGLVQFDEVQRVASKTAYSVRYMFTNADFAFGYSASPWRDDGTDLCIEAAFGRRIVDIPASMLIKQGYLVQPIIHIRKSMCSTFTGSKYQEIYQSAIVENQLRNMQVAMDAVEFYNAGISTLILVRILDHGERIANVCKAMGIHALFISGKSRMKVRRKAIEDMRSGKVMLLIASTIADVGLDIPRLGAIVEAGVGKSSVTALQRLGRIMRPFPGKDYCHFVTYRDNVPFIQEHVDRKIKIWRTEPMFQIIEEG